MKQSENTVNKWIIFPLVAVAVFMSTLDSSIVNIALPWIMKDLGTQLTTIEWVVLIYLLTVTSLLLTFGRISDIKGRRIVYCGGFFIFALGSFFCAISANVSFLIISRTVQGIGAAMLMACSPAIVIDIFPPATRGKALGMIGTVVAIGLATGPGLGGLILKYFSWRVIFSINVPIGIIATVLAFKILNDNIENAGKNESIDWKGSFFIIICLSTFLLAVTHLHEWEITYVLGLTGIAILSLIGFIFLEIKSSSPLFDFSLLKIRLFILPTIASVIMFAVLFIIVFLMPFYLSHPCGFSPGKIGTIMMTPFVFSFFLSPLSGVIYDKIGSRMLCTLGTALMTLSFISFTSLEPSFPEFSIIWRLALAGTGIAIFISPNSSVAMSAVPKNQRGVASGSVAAARNLGMIIGIALAGLIFNTIFFKLSGGAGMKDYTPLMESYFMSAFHCAMFAGALLSGVGIIISFLRGNDSYIK